MRRIRWFITAWLEAGFNFPRENKMPLLNKQNYSALADSSSYYNTSFKNPQDLKSQAGNAEKIEDSEQAANKGKENQPEYMPIYSENIKNTPTERLGNRRFKAVYYRAGYGKSTSTGTSAIRYPCLTTGVGACIVVMISGGSADRKKRNSREFHCFPRNRTLAAFVDYAKCLDENELKNKKAVIAGGYGPKHRQKLIEKYGEEAADMLINAITEHIRKIKEKLSDLNINLEVDNAGENRPDNITVESNIGFEHEISEETDEVEFRYHPNYSME